MRLHRSSLMTGVALAAMVTAAPMAQAQMTSPETGQGTADEQRLTCEAEVRALRDTFRAEEEYAEAEIADRFEALILEADEAAVRDEDGVCYVNLIQAQQLLADSGIALEGYSDQVAIFETIERAQAAGAFTSAEAEQARQRTEVTVTARPARVAVTPQAALVEIEREATQVEVSQRPSEIVVEQPQSTVNVQQAQPDVDVNQPAPEVDVQAAAPEVEVVQPAPEIDVEQAQPEIDVSQAQPEVTIEQPQPQITVRQFKPEVEITQPQPEIRVQQQQPEIAVVQPQPEVTVETAEPVVTVEQAEPDVDVAYAAPEVDVTQREPEVEVEAQQPRVSVTEAQPEVSVTQDQPQVQVSQAQPQVNVDQDRAQVQVSQERAQVEASMGEAQVSFDAEEGVQLDASREQGVEVTVDREAEPTIEIVAVREMPRQVADLQPLAIEEIEFQFDEATLSDAAMTNIEDAVNVMDEGSHAVLVGFASPIGDPDYNLELSRERVQAVHDQLVEMGVDPSRITSYAAGEDATEQGGNVEQTRTEENRRVEIRIIPAEMMAGQDQG